MLGEGDLNIKNIRKKLAEKIWELGFIIMPKLKDAVYLERTFTGMNLKYLKIKSGKGNGTPVKDRVEPWIW